MLTTEPTAEMIAEWKRIFEKYHSSLTPDRKTGEEVDKYFRGKYPCTASDNEEFREAVYFNITGNEYSKSKLKNGTLPDIRCYKTGNVLVGIDLNSGEFHMESENIEDIIPIHDDLFVYRGLDAEDIKNYFLVAEYVKLSAKANKNE